MFARSQPPSLPEQPAIPDRSRSLQNGLPLNPCATFQANAPTFKALNSSFTPASSRTRGTSQFTAVHHYTIG
jgi:hypothetical protein